MEASTALSLGEVAVNLGPAFAAGFAVQQFLQILDPVVSKVVETPDNKKAILGLISFGLGVVFSLSGLRILAAIAPNRAIWVPADVVVSALFISAGTEGFNSIMKFLSYQKESAKANAAVKKAAAVDTAVPDATATGALSLV